MSDQIERLGAENDKLRAELAAETNLKAEYFGKLTAANLQDAAMRRALTDIMQFSSDERSRTVAKGILDAHGGPDPECMVKPVNPECKCVWMDCGPIGMERSRKSPCPIHPFP